MSVQFCSLNAVSLPPGMTNIWGIPEVSLVGYRVVILVELSSSEKHRLAFATWQEVPWRVVDSHRSFVGFVQDSAIPQSWRTSPGEGTVGMTFLGSGGRLTVKDGLRESTPKTLAGDVDTLRDRLMGLERVGRVNLVLKDDVLHYWTAKGRKLTWRETDPENHTGTLTVDFGEGGSHQFLRDLIMRFGFPEEALQPLGH